MTDADLTPEQRERLRIVIERLEPQTLERLVEIAETYERTQWLGKWAFRILIGVAAVIGALNQMRGIEWPWHR